MKRLTITALVCIFIFWAGIAFADRGVFNAKVTPNETLTNTPTTIKVTAEIGSENLYISSVRAYQTSETGQPISQLCQMYDDGTHGDERPADTIFTCHVALNQSTESKFYVRVTAAYQGDRNRYLSPVLKVSIYEPMPEGAVEEIVSIVHNLEQNFNLYIQSVGIDTARQMALQDALNNPNVTSANLSGNTLAIVYRGRIRGIAFLNDPSVPTLQASIYNLPQNSKTPGNNELLIFAPYYGDGITLDADHAQSRFDNSAFMQFVPDPPDITKDGNASLEVVKRWGDHGTVIIYGHGGFWNDEVVIMTGTSVASFLPDLALYFLTGIITPNIASFITDLVTGRVGLGADGRLGVYPSFITKYNSPMKNTFFYLGTCHGLENNSMWDALSAKGAKVGFGWSKSVCIPFDANTFQQLIDPMLPTEVTTAPVTAKQAFDAIIDKIDDSIPNCSEGAELMMKTTSSEWENFVFYEGGLVNGNFETGDFTGWVTGADPGNNYKIVSGARKHAGSFSGALGRWDTAYHGYDPTAEPLGYEWFYQDFVVPHNVTYLKFYWWMETYDTALWDWFDAYIKDTNGNILKTILYHAGKPGSNYGPYWTTQMAYGGTGWQEAKVDISAYRGQKIRIYFDQRLDGYGDQQRVYIDDVTLE